MAPFYTGVDTTSEYSLAPVYELWIGEEVSSNARAAESAVFRGVFWRLRELARGVFLYALYFSDDSFASGYFFVRNVADRHFF